MAATEPRKISQTPYRLFSQRWFWLLTAHAVLSQMATLLLRVTTSYRAIEIDLAPGWLAIFSVAFSVFPLLFGILAGRATDRYGERSTLIVGAAIVLLAAGGFLLFGNSVAGLLICNVLLGVGHLLGMLGEQSIAANNGPSVQRDRIFGYYTVFVSFGQVLSPLVIAGFSGDAVIPDTGAIFQGSAVIAALTLAFSAPFRSSSRPQASNSATPPGSVLSLFRIPGMLAALLASVIVLASMDLLLVYLPALGTERHIEAATITTLLSLRAVAAMLSRLCFHALIARLGRARLLIGSIALATLSVIAIPIGMPLWALGAVICVAGFVLGLCLPLTLAWMTEISPPTVRGTVISLRLVGNRLGQTVISSAASLVAVSIGIAGVFWFSGAALALVALTTARAFAGQKPASKT